jgi:hypothetical protein
VTEDSGMDWNPYEMVTGETHNDNEGLREATYEHYEFWHSRPELLSIYENSRRTMIAPWTMLGMTIVRSLLSIPYWVQYQSFMGRAPLNIGCIFIGDSGAGKSRLSKVLDAALPFTGQFVPDFKQVEVGSGEAMADVYAFPAEKDEPEIGLKRGDLIWKNISHARLFGFDEVGRLFKLGNRDQGSTVFEYVKQGLSGGPMGRYLAKGAGTFLDGDSYRFGFVTNAQPTRCGVLLNPDEVEGGFPGRMLWLESRDPRAVTEHDPSPIVEFNIPSIEWTPINVVRALPQMDEAHRKSAEDFHLDKRDPIDGHIALLRAKVAVALMRLNGRTVLNDEDWDLSGVILDESIRVRTWVQSVLASKRKDEDQARGESLARQQAAAQEAAVTLRMKRITDRLIAFQAKGMPQNLWRRTLNSEDRPFYDDALAVWKGWEQ